MLRNVLWITATVVLAAAAGLYPSWASRQNEKAAARGRIPDVGFSATPHDVVAKMLKLAEVRRDDLVYDLGCGDGRLVVAAAKQYGCRAVGYDIDPDCVERARRNVKHSGVDDLVRIKQADIFALDLSQADVILLYLLPDLNIRLTPQLEKLKPGARIVSHEFGMGVVEPDLVVEHVSAEDNRPHAIFFWTAPLKKK
ncbi:MAG: methyltransferase domain-containing protein [Pirellulales bacterium]|nr:methyltransferase domain-containing protein [Pirellulales bacterium]